jgi:hypothetical protein
MLFENPFCKMHILTKDNEFSLLKKEAPGLSGRIFRTYGLIPENCHHAYELAAIHGGNNEIWFIREEGSSYNPRAARIAVILLQGSSDTSAEILCLGMLSSLLIYPDSVQRIENHDFPDNRIFQDFISLCNYFKADLNVKTQISPWYIKIYISLFIDKMRHVHLSDGDISSLIRETIHEAEHYLHLSEKHFPYYKPYIDKWINRFSNHENISVISRK